MKKIFLLFLCISFIFCGCTNENLNTEPGTTNLEKTEAVTEKESFRGVWLTYSELSVKGKNYTEETYRKYIAELFYSFREKGINNVFVHVRPFADALYFSEVFESSEYSSGQRGKKADFDILRICTEEAKKSQLKIHGWLNPYRVLAVPDTDRITDGAISRLMKEDESAVTVTSDGIYLNPASDKVQKLIVDGVREILQNYQVDGIHFDDYFYPPTFENGDKKEYEEYLQSGGRLSLEDFRREKVSSLLLLTYNTVKSYGKNLVFSVSPTGDIDKNINEIYADVPLWSEGGYCDMLIPQLYFGFENESKPFERELSKWIELTENSEVKLVIGLALYKVGESDIFAGSGKNEWLNNTDVIERQIKLAEERGCDGVAFFSSGHIGKLN